jgi:hypothetical protein
MQAGDPAGDRPLAAVLVGDVASPSPNMGFAPREALIEGKG